MSLITKETLLTHLQRAEMADSVTLPIEFFRDLVYQAMPREWVGLTDEEIDQGLLRSDYALQSAHAWRSGVVFAMTQLKEKNAL